MRRNTGLVVVVLFITPVAASSCGDESAAPATPPRKPPPLAPPASDVDDHATAPDDITAASAAAPAREVTGDDELGVAWLVARNRARMTRERTATVRVHASRDPVEAGRRLCEDVVPRRPPETPVLLKPNLAGINLLRPFRLDDGVQLRTTGIGFLRGVIQCLKARGHREITIVEVWTRPEQLDDWKRATGLDRLIVDEGVRVVGLWDEGEPLSAPHPGARRLHTGLRVPRVVARHLRDGLFITIPRLKMHRFAVMTLAIKNHMGLVVMDGAEAPATNASRMHRELGPWLTAYRERGHDDRDAYVAALEAFAERIVDYFEIATPDAALIDGVPPVAGDGFSRIEPLDEGIAIGSTNPVFADAVALEYMGYLDNAALAREIGHRTSPLVEEAARRFWGSTEALRGVRVEGDASFRERPRVAHYRAMPGFEIGAPPAVMGELPWISSAVTAARGEAPTVDGALDDPAWVGAQPVRIDTDWRGEPVDGLETVVRVTWTPSDLYVGWDCAYDELDVDDAPVEDEHQTLYRHDVVEVFLDPSPRSTSTYVELEVGPGGHFLDVDVNRARRPRGDVAWSSGMQVAARIDEDAKRFTIEMRVPARALGRTHLEPSEHRLGLYRIAGRAPERTHLALFPTHTEEPSFHVPERFGWLRLVDRP